MPVQNDEIAKHFEVVDLLEKVCQDLELSDSSYAEAEATYQAVGKWLAASEHALLRDMVVYAQGSVALCTTVRPIGRLEHDIDLVSHSPHVKPLTEPALFKKVVGERLREHAVYEKMLEEKPRCWRLVYARQFHLDITPSIVNIACSQGGELVPDKVVRIWKATNPKGYRKRFEQVAALRPRVEMFRKRMLEARGDVEPLPDPSGFKGMLRRIVQLLKRHRDVWFLNDKSGLAPISIILTTLAAESYGFHASRSSYATELDFVLAVVRDLPRFIEQVVTREGTRYVILNPTTEGENFAEKWNSDPRLARAFFTWHAGAVSHFEGLLSAVGIDQFRKRLTESFGDTGARAVDQMTDETSAARSAGLLSVAAGAGVSRVAVPGASVPVRPNTFFGR
jgi:hypothetical protein